ncbi:MAG TPA: FAD-dependent oxidoreductase, partial [Nitrospirae bacterium]|nr:FAD-dependent oxidoreductase [Nitrospirota bacterium]
MDINSKQNGIVVLGGGLAGLSAGYVLSREGEKVLVVEGDSTVGGLSKTYKHNGFMFDLGGHRFITHNRLLERFVNELLKGEFLKVPRTSQIYMFGRYFDYPLKPINAMFGLGILTSLQILLDYWKEKVKNALTPPEIISLEDWVV